MFCFIVRTKFVIKKCVTFQLRLDSTGRKLDCRPYSFILEMKFILNEQSLTKLLRFFSKFLTLKR